MKIRYKKQQLNFKLIFGIIWLLFFGLKFIFQQTFHWIEYGWILISLGFLGMYFYQKKYHYITISNGILTIKPPFGKSINIAEIQQIKQFAGDYILKTDKEKLTINTQIIDPNSLAKLTTELKKLNVEWV